MKTTIAVFLLALPLCLGQAPTTINSSDLANAEYITINSNFTSLFGSKVAYKGTYSSGTTYGNNDLVLSGAAAYISSQAGNTGNTPAASPSYWTPLPQNTYTLTSAGIASALGFTPQNAATTPVAATVAPLIDGTAAVGTSVLYARQDHVHPTDTSRAPVASPALTGTPTAPTGTAGDTSTQVATNAFATAAATAVRSASVTGIRKGNGASPDTVAVAGTDYNAVSPAVFEVDSYPSSCTIGGTAYTSATDCAFYTAKAYTVAHSVNSKIHFGCGYYTTNGLVAPTIGLYTVSFEGGGPFCSYITYIGTTGHAVISKGVPSGAFGLLVLTGLSIDANNLANSAFDLWGLNQSEIGNLHILNVASGSDHYAQIGQTNPSLNAGTGGAYQVHAHDITVVNPYPHPSSDANITATVSGGHLSYTIVSGGAGYQTANLRGFVYGYQNGTSDHPCSTMPVLVLTQSGGAINSITESTASAGCVGTVDIQAINLPNIAKGIDWNASDSTGVDLSIYAGLTAGLDVSGGDNTFLHTHPTDIPVGIRIEAYTNNTFVGDELDSIGHYGYDIETDYGTTIVGPHTFMAGHIKPGSSTFYFGSGSDYINLSAIGNLCTGTKPSDYHEFVMPTGTYDGGVLLPLHASVIGNDSLCGSGIDVVSQTTKFSNLISSGGYIDGSPIGNTVPASGTFTNAVVAPFGVAASGTNYYSNILAFKGSYGAGLTDSYQFQNNVFGGTNPFTQLTITHSGSTGGNQVNFLPFVSLSGGSALPNAYVTLGGVDSSPIGATTPSTGAFTTASAAHVIGSSSTPAFTSGAGAGTSPTIVVVAGSTDLSGYVTVTTGTSPTASAGVFTLNFATAYAVAPKCFASPANAATQALAGAAGASIYPVNTTTAHFVLTQGATALAASTAYEWGYTCTQ